MGVPDWVIGVLMACVASVISNLGLNLQKLSHVRTAKLVAAQKAAEQAASYSSTNGAEGDSIPHPPPLDKKKTSYVRQPIWQLGLGMVILGSFADFIALGFAPQSVVAPLGSLTLVSNVVFAPLLLHEKIERKDLFSTGAIVVGSIVAVAFASHEDTSPSGLKQMFALYEEWRFIAYAITVIIFMGALRFLLHHVDKIHRHAPPQAYAKVMAYHRFAYAALAGTMGAQSVLFAKCTAQLLVLSFGGQGFMFGYIQTYLVLGGLGGTIFFQIKWLNSGLRLFSSVYIVPVFQSFWILISVVAGMIFFKEYQDVLDSTTKTIMFPMGIALTITGVYFLSQKEHVDSNAPAKPSAQSPLLLPVQGGEDSDEEEGRHDVTVASEDDFGNALALQHTTTTRRASFDEALRTPSLITIGGAVILFSDGAGAV